MKHHTGDGGPDGSGGSGACCRRSIENDVEGSALGAWCGIAAPLVLGTYLAVAARLRRGYDRTATRMSALGRRRRRRRFGFLVVNVAVGVLLYVFAAGRLRPRVRRPWRCRRRRRDIGPDRPDGR